MKAFFKKILTALEKSHEHRVARYLAMRSPQNAAEVNFWIQEYHRKS